MLLVGGNLLFLSRERDAAEDSADTAEDEQLGLFVSRSFVVRAHSSQTDVKVSVNEEEV